jgi:hypothetical protein
VIIVATLLVGITVSSAVSHGLATLLFSIRSLGTKDRIEK